MHVMSSVYICNPTCSNCVYGDIVIYVNDYSYCKLVFSFFSQSLVERVSAVYCSQLYFTLLQVPGEHITPPSPAPHDTIAPPSIP